MLPLDVRKVRILQAVVNDYVQTSKPVGSERLIEVYKLGCKSATVRNEMAEMAEMGYLVQPHTSAGRIPTDRGYRYYVDELMNPPAALAPEDTRRAQDAYEKAQSEVADLVLQTCRILSGLTSYASIATDPLTEATTLRRIYLTGASPRHILLVALLSTGHVEHRLIELETAPGDRALAPLANYLNAQIAGHDLEEVGRRLRGLETPNNMAAHASTLAKVVTTLAQVTAALSERRVFLEGANQLLRQPEFQDVQRLEILFHALEQRNALYQVLRRALLGSDIAIIIGHENAYEPMQECSVITTSYRIGNRMAGYLGVVGPTRMNYDRVVAAVNLMASSLSQVLTNLSMA
ncbi:MAG TPA: heat-inducible transcriptional repressor HrcA [Chthonomonadaceae bacterium]|nr:heat-inducible transcriptional repressor HrcA [Chthonomonadaceae bacterium]